MKTIGIIPGSFNPIHAGHSHLAIEGLVTYKMDEVRFVPAYQNPFKNPYELSFQQRCELIVYHIYSAETHNQSLARANPFEWENKNVSVWRIEETITKLKGKMGNKFQGNFFFEVAEWISNLEEYKENRFVLLLGEDILHEFSRWSRPDRIMELFDIIFIRRIGTKYGTVSSTDVRKMIQNGIRPDSIVTKVYNQLKEWGTYA